MGRGQGKTRSTDQPLIECDKVNGLIGGDPGFGTKHPGGERVPGEYLTTHIIEEAQR